MAARAVIFDLDGTLVDSYSAIAECFNHARTSLGREPLPEAQVRPLVGHGLESLMEDAVGAALAAEAVKLFRARYETICTERTLPLPGARETLLALAQRGRRLGVATNKPARFAARILRRLDMMPPLEVVAGPGPLPPKPDPALLLDVVRALQTPPERCLYVGDMGVDVETARRAGLQVWVIASGSATRSELEAAGPDRILERLQDLTLP